MRNAATLGLRSALAAGCETLETPEAVNFHMQFRQMEIDAARQPGRSVEATLRELDGQRYLCRDRACSLGVAEEIPEFLGLEEHMYEFVASETALRAGAYAAAKAARDRVWSDINRAGSSIYAEMQGLPVNVPTVTDDFYRRGNATGIVLRPSARPRPCPTAITVSSRWPTTASPGGATPAPTP